MSFMIKIAFVVQATLTAAVGINTSASTPAPAPAATTSVATEQAIPEPVLERASCDVCYEIYDSCIAEGVTPAGCQRLSANCFRTCLP